MEKTQTTYIFNQCITPFGMYTPTDEEFEEICINADDDRIIICSNCYAMLNTDQNTNRPI